MRASRSRAWHLCVRRGSCDRQLVETCSPCCRPLRSAVGPSRRGSGGDGTGAGYGPGWRPVRGGLGCALSLSCGSGLSSRSGSRRGSGSRRRPGPSCGSGPSSRLRASSGLGAGLGHGLRLRSGLGLRLRNRLRLRSGLRLGLGNRLRLQNGLRLQVRLRLRSAIDLRSTLGALGVGALSWLGTLRPGGISLPAVRADDHGHVAAVLLGRGLDETKLLDIPRQTLQQPEPELGPGLLASAEHDGHLDLVPRLEEPLDVALLGAVVVRVDLGPELDLLDDRLGLVLA